MANYASSPPSFASNAMTNEEYNAHAGRFQIWIESAITKAKQAISDNRLDILRERREKPRGIMRRKLEDRECERREELFGEEQERIRLWQEEQLKFFAECRKRREQERANMYGWENDDGLVHVVENGSG
ncbi:hypothetical protein RUND412_000443 [Rhizina undulata]